MNKTIVTIETFYGKGVVEEFAEDLDAETLVDMCMRACVGAGWHSDSIKDAVVEISRAILRAEMPDGDVSTT